MTTSLWPAAVDNIPVNWDPALATALLTDSVNAMQADLGPVGSTRGGHTRAVATPTITTGTAYHNALPYDVRLTVQVATAGTVAIAISPDGTTYTTLEAARAVAATGAGNVTVDIPAGWYAKLTATTTVLGSAFAY